jgi:Domain of unknown function (DUF4157)
MRQFAMRGPAAADSIRVNRQPALVLRTPASQRSTSPAMEGGWDLSRVPVRNDPPVRVQAKLMVGQTDDPAEQEADRIADAVMRMPDPGGPAPSARLTSCDAIAPAAPIQTKATRGSGNAGFEAPPIVHDVLLSSGQPLDAATRAYFEPRFGHDFSSVRIRTGALAAEAVSTIGARAFTSHRNIVFGADQFAPHTSEGRHLIAHELCHVLHQRHGASAILRKRDDKAKKKQAAAASSYRWEPEPGASIGADDLHAVPTYLTGISQRRIQPASLSDLSGKINEIGGEVKSGAFAKVVVDAKIPLEVPTLFLIVKFDGKYTRTDKSAKLGATDEKAAETKTQPEGQEQELELKASIGAELKVWEFISLSLEKFVYMNLSGEDLGAALSDALRQALFHLLKDKGIDQAFLQHVLAHPKDKDLLNTYLKYRKFFADDPSVGFELGIGTKLSATAKSDEENEIGGSLEEISGLEDVDKKEAKAFKETALAGHVKVDGNQIELRLSKREREDRSKLVKFQLNGELGGTFAKTELKAIASKAESLLVSREWIYVMTRVGQADGGEGLTFEGIASALSTAFPPIGKKKFGKIELEPKFELELSVEHETGSTRSNWKVVARVSQAAGLKASPKLGPAELSVDVQVGQFFDISGEIKKFLDTVYKPQPKIPKPPTLAPTKKFQSDRDLSSHPLVR